MVYRGVMLAGAVLLLGGCGDAAPVGNSGVQSSADPAPSAAPAPTPAPAAPRAATAQASTVETKTPDYSFTYRYPAAAAAIPALKSWLDADRAAIRAEVARDSAAFRRETTANDFPFRQYESSTVWKVVTETPRLLSLSAEIYEYTGGAHGSPGFRATVWDKANERRVAPEAMFTSGSAIQAAVGDAFCKALDRERARRRGAPVVRGSDSFSTCPRVADATLILGSSDRRTIDRIGFLVGPYVAGPYAEGSYDLTLPVTPAVLNAVRADYRDAFTAR